MIFPSDGSRSNEEDVRKAFRDEIDDMRTNYEGYGDIPPSIREILEEFLEQS